MPNMGPRHGWFRREVWALIDDCRECRRDTCPNWCEEFVSVQMDELLDKLIEAMRRELRSPA